MRPVEAAGVTSEAFVQLDRWMEALPSPLRRLGRDLPQALGGPVGEDLASSWGHRLDFLVSVPHRLAARYGGERVAHVASQAAFGALCGYFYIRIQDNVLDEPECIDSAYLLLGNELVREFFDRYRRLFPRRHPFWPVFRAWWQETSRFTLWEKLAHGRRYAPFAPSALLRLGKKHGAAKIPMAAVCFAAGAAADIPRYARFLDAIHLAGQLLNDVVSLARDLEHRHVSYVAGRALAVSEERGGGSVEAIVGRALMTTELEEVLDRAEAIAAAAGCALGPRAADFEDAVEARVEAIRGVRASLVGAKLRALLAPVLEPAGPNQEAPSTASTGAGGHGRRTAE